MTDLPTDVKGMLRVSAREAIPAGIADQGGAYLLEKVVLKLSQRVAKKCAGKNITGATIYITYEAIVDDTDDTGPGRPVRAFANRSAAGVVLGPVLEGRAA